MKQVGLDSHGSLSASMKRKNFHGGTYCTRGSMEEVDYHFFRESTPCGIYIYISDSSVHFDVYTHNRQTDRESGTDCRDGGWNTSHAQGINRWTKLSRVGTPEEVLPRDLRGSRPAVSKKRSDYTASTERGDDARKEALRMHDLGTRGHYTGHCGQQTSDSYCAGSNRVYLQSGHTDCLSSPIHTDCCLNVHLKSSLA